MAQGIGRFNLFGHDEHAASRRRLDRVDFAKFLRQQRQRVEYALESGEQRLRQRLIAHSRTGEAFTTLVKTAHETTSYVQDEQPFDLSAEAGRIRRRYQE
jgi:hypothetical protein